MPRQDSARLQARSRVEAGQRQRLLEVAKGLAATLGNDFFRSMVNSLGTTLDVECAYIGELGGTPVDRLATVAVYQRHHKSENFEQTLPGTAVAQVVQDGLFARSQEVRQFFPRDARLEATHAEGYAGIRLTDSTGQPVGVLAVVSITRMADLQLVKSVLETFAPRAAAEIERKRNDDLHRENEERYHAFVATNPDAMWRIEFEEPISLKLPEEEQLERMYRFGYLAECNDASARLYGQQSAADLVGWRFDEFAPRTDGRLAQEVAAAIHTGFRYSSVETSARDQNGNAFYRLRSLFGVVEDGELRRLWGTTRDITDLRRAELSAAVSVRRFRKVLEGVQLPAVMLDPHGTVAFCNACFLRLANRSMAQLSELSWLEGVITAAEADIWKAAMTGDSATHHFEGSIIRPTAPPRIVLWDTICLHNGDDELTGLAAIGWDLTDHRALEEQNRLSQKMESVGRLAAGVAHDFNNFLMVIMGHTEVLLQGRAESDPAHPSLSAISNAAARCAGLVNQLLAFGRKQQLRPRHIDLNDLIDAEMSIIRTLLGDGISLSVNPAPQLRLVYADPAQIQRILTNLVKNAVDAMPLGGKLVISTSNVSVGEHDAVHPGIAPGAFVGISIADNGIGINEEVKSHLFEPFFTTKPMGKGTGLGLPTVYGIVAQCGGHLTVRSEPGHGTTFDILLPAVSTEVAE